MQTPELLVATDLDFVDMFGKAEWPCIRSALQSHFLEVLAWTRVPASIRLCHHSSQGAVFATNRRAEQGDVLGTIQSALVLEGAR